MAEQHNGESRKQYSAPKIVHTEKLQAQASTCAKADDGCAPGPLAS
jgi:hypothetical protein